MEKTNLFMSIKEKLKQYKAALIEEEKAKKRLVSKELDYAYLEQLVKRCESNKDLVIEIDTADHAHIVIKTDRKPLKLKSQVLFEALEDS